MYTARKSSITSIENSRKRRKGRGSVIAPITDNNPQDVVLSSSWSNHKQQDEFQDDETDATTNVSCSFQDSSLLRMDSIHGKIILSKSLTEHRSISDLQTLGASPGTPMVVGSLIHSESSPFKEVIPHSILQKQHSKDRINSSLITPGAVRNHKIDCEDQSTGEPFHTDNNAGSENYKSQISQSLTDNQQQLDECDGVAVADSNCAKNALNEHLNSNISKDIASTDKNDFSRNLSDLLNQDPGNIDYTTRNGFLTTDDDDKDKLSDQIPKDFLSRNKLDYNHSTVGDDNDTLSTEDTSSLNHESNQIESTDDNRQIEQDSPTINHSQSSVDELLIDKPPIQSDTDTNYDVLPPPSNNNTLECETEYGVTTDARIVRSQTKIDDTDDDLTNRNDAVIAFSDNDDTHGTGNLQSVVGGSQQLVDVLKLGTSVNSVNDYFIPGIHASPPPEPEPNVEPESISSHSFGGNSSRSSRHKANSLPREERLSGVLGTSFESSGNFSDSGSDCFSEQSFSLLAELGITDDFIGIKEDHFSTEVSFMFFPFSYCF